MRAIAARIVSRALRGPFRRERRQASVPALKRAGHPPPQRIQDRPSLHRALLRFELAVRTAVYAAPRNLNVTPGGMRSGGGPPAPLAAALCFLVGYGARHLPLVRRIL